MSHNKDLGDNTGDISQCPVDEETRLKWLQQQDNSNNDSSTILSTEREISGIPRTGSNGQKWVYPSEKQFYDAMTRKNFKDTNKMDMKTVIPIHNNVNERVWNYIKKWENVTSEDAFKLLSLTSFKGDSKKITPRAWIRHYILGMDLPFDRHDWQINHKLNLSSNESINIDYVIDFYMNKQQGVYLDVRPKLNSFEGCKKRLLHFLGL
ncbi:similar to Saccharomyces cerevisiae YKL087C CYT2 Cytochrome c1 heme lyase [Maudiozyma saulgeensis]|uniref:Holocytochrome c-type synthase n=1 Tax=Maudiozyma saulgeensis TaxID=1789683 RepID=A0A1X7R9J8_9SACH|nr:similar to Saccharomyces cerevisiae YKL087C CYT2 Cytochrome c1 heme lyase [Kazachstania saulgeensis]